MTVVTTGLMASSLPADKRRFWAILWHLLPQPLRNEWTAYGITLVKQIEMFPMVICHLRCRTIIMQGRILQMTDVSLAPSGCRESWCHMALIIRFCQKVDIDP